MPGQPLGGGQIRPGGPGGPGTGNLFGNNVGDPLGQGRGKPPG